MLCTFFLLEKGHTTIGDYMLYTLKKILYLLLIITLFSWLVSYLQIFSIIGWLFTISMPLILAFIFRFLFDPMTKHLTDKKRKAVCIIIYASILLCLVGGLYLLIPTVIEQCMNIYKSYDFTNIEKYMHPFFKPIYEFLVSLNIWDFLFDMFCSMSESLSYWFTNILLAFGISFYLVYDDFHITTWLSKKTFAYKAQIVTVLQQGKEVTYAFIKATFIDFILFFVASVIIFNFIGFDYVYYIALFLALTNLIAYIGPYIGGIPIVIYGFFLSTNTGYFALLAIIILQIIESNFVQPLLFKKCLATSPIASIVALSVFGDFFGIAGMIIAPLLLAYLIIIKNILVVEKKE